MKCECRCGSCCEDLIIEATEDDARREPKIKQLAEKYKDIAAYLLNSKEAPHHCIFYRKEGETGICTIYATRPKGCKEFDCDDKDRERLVELGILPPR